MNIKTTKIYVCPICKKEYKRKGFYLTKHLKSCNAIAWIPKVKTEIVYREIDFDTFVKAIENLASGNYKSNIEPIERIKQSKQKALENIDLERIYSYKDVMTELKQKFNSNQPILTSYI